MRLVWSADIHLRNQPPKVSNDKSWKDVQEQMLNKIVDICIEKNCDLYVGGDLYHSTRDTTFELICMVQACALRLKKHNLAMYILCGNHDLYGHSSSNVYRCAIGTTLGSVNIFNMKDSPIGCGNFDEETPNEKIIAKHVLCFPDIDSIPPNVNATTAPMLLKEYDKAKWIFTGDYHHNYHYERNGRHVVNPGCTSIQVADMLDYECGVYFVDTDSEDVEWIPLNIEQSFYDKTEIEPDIDMEAFADSITLHNVTFDFDTNVNNALLHQSEDVKNKVRSWQ